MCVCVCVENSHLCYIISLRLDVTRVKMSIELVEGVGQSLLSLLVWLHHHSLEIDWKTIPASHTHTHTHTPIFNLTHRQMHKHTQTHSFSRSDIVCTQIHTQSPFSYSLTHTNTLFFSFRHSMYTNTHTISLFLFSHIHKYTLFQTYTNVQYTVLFTIHKYSLFTSVYIPVHKPHTLSLFFMHTHFLFDMYTNHTFYLSSQTHTLTPSHPHTLTPSHTLSLST